MKKTQLDKNRTKNIAKNGDNTTKENLNVKLCKANQEIDT